MPSLYSMSVQIPVPVVIYGLVLLAYTVSQYFTVKYLCEAIKAMREERAELWRLSQKVSNVGAKAETEKASAHPHNPKERSHA